ncbi:short-chain dehydrogenase [Variovorax fucosicus]|uniref:short-chain dehydrogenase n=1 Tax=Variovorax fucosicus TaxID=3053517 RepID=UPI002576EDF9|nr:short-chain dehydrogenase [Variovorax sp. J22G47]MDM0055904.1 short-chain dehydrogenase [Variovorax sp. J22G47]
MRKRRQTPIRTIAVLPAPPARSRMVSALVRLMSHTVPKSEPRVRRDDLDCMDLDQRVRALGEW